MPADASQNSGSIDAPSQTYRVGPVTGWVRRLVFVCAVIAVGNIATNLFRLPREVPTHIGVSGEPDAWGPPGTAIAGIIVTSAIACGMAWLSTRSFRLNVPFPVHEGNEVRLHRIAGQMLAQLALAIGMLAVSISYTTFQLWNTNPLTIAAMALLFCALIVGMIRIFSSRSR